MSDEVGKIQIPVDVTGTEGAVGNLGKVSAAYDKNTAAIERSAAKQGKLAGGLSAAAGQFSTTRAGAVNMAKSLDSAAGSMNQVGMKAVRGGGLVTAGLGLAIHAGMGFDKQMSVVKAATGAQTADFARLRKAAIDWGSRSQFSATEVAESMTELGKAGYDTNQTLSALPGVLDAASASGEDMASVTSILVDTLTPFHMAADKAGHVTDGLAYAANATTGSIGDFGEAMKYVAPIALKAGQNFDQTNAALVVLAKNGIKGSMAGTSLRGVLLSMEAPNKLVQKSMDKVGLSFRDSSGKMLPLATNIDKLKGKLAEMSKTEADKFLVKMFGKENISAAQAFLDTGGAGLRKFTDESIKSNGAAKDFAATLRDNLSGDLENLGGKLESAAINITDDLSPALRGITGVIGGAVDKFNGLDGATRSTISTLTALGGVSILGLGLLGVTAGAVASGLSAIVLVGGTAAAGLAAVGAAAGTLVFDLAVAGGAMEAFGLAMAANPVMAGAAVILGVAAAVYMVSRAMHDTEQKARSAGDAIKEMKDAVNNLHSAQQGTKDSVFGLADAKNNLSSAKDQVHDAKNAQEKKAALLELQKAYNQLSVAQSAYNTHVQEEITQHNIVGGKITKEADDQAKYAVQIEKASKALKDFKSNKDLYRNAQAKDDDGTFKFPVLAKQLQDLKKNLSDGQKAMADSKKRMGTLQREQNADLAKQVQEANRLYKLTGTVTPTLANYLAGLRSKGGAAMKAAGYTRDQINAILKKAGYVSPSEQWKANFDRMMAEARASAAQGIKVAITTTHNVVNNVRNVVEDVTGLDLGGSKTQSKGGPNSKTQSNARTYGVQRGNDAGGGNGAYSYGRQTYARKRRPHVAPLPPRTAPVPKVVGGMIAGDSFNPGNSISNLGSLAGAPTLEGLLASGLEGAKPTAKGLEGQVKAEVARANHLIERRNALITKLIPGAKRELEVRRRARKAAATALSNAQKALKKAKGKKPIAAARAAVNAASAAYKKADAAFVRQQDVVQRLSGERDDGGEELEGLAGEIISDELALEEATATRDADGNITAYGVGALPGIQSGDVPAASTSGGAGGSTDAPPDTVGTAPQVAAGMNYTVGVGFGSGGGITIAGMSIQAGNYQQGQDAARGFFDALGAGRDGVTFSSNAVGVG